MKILGNSLGEYKEVKIVSPQVSPNDREYKKYDASAGTAEVREEGGRRRRNDVGGGCGAVRSAIDRRGGLGRNG